MMSAEAVWALRIALITVSVYVAGLTMVLTWHHRDELHFWQGLTRVSSAGMYLSTAFALLSTLNNWDPGGRLVCLGACLGGAATGLTGTLLEKSPWFNRLKKQTRESALYRRVRCFGRRR